MNSHNWQHAIYTKVFMQACPNHINMLNRHLRHAMVLKVPKLYQKFMHKPEQEIYLDCFRFPARKKGISLTFGGFKQKRKLQEGCPRGLGAAMNLWW